MIANAGRRRSDRTTAEGEMVGPAGGTRGVGVVATQSSGLLGQSEDADELSAGAASQSAAVRQVAQIEAVVVNLGAAEAGTQTAAADKESFAERFLATTGFAPAVLLAAVGIGGKSVGCLVVPDHLDHAAERFGGEGLARSVG